MPRPSRAARLTAACLGTRAPGSSCSPTHPGMLSSARPAPAPHASTRSSLPRSLNQTVAGPRPVRVALHSPSGRTRREGPLSPLTARVARRSSGRRRGSTRDRASKVGQLCMNHKLPVHCDTVRHRGPPPDVHGRDRSSPATPPARAVHRLRASETPVSGAPARRIPLAGHMGGCIKRRPKGNLPRWNPRSCRARQRGRLDSTRAYRLGTGADGSAARCRSCFSPGVRSIGSGGQRSHRPGGQGRRPTSCSHGGSCDMPRGSRCLPHTLHGV